MSTTPTTISTSKTSTIHRKEEKTTARLRGRRPQQDQRCDDDDYVSGHRRAAIDEAYDKTRLLRLLRLVTGGLELRFRFRKNDADRHEEQPRSYEEEDGSIVGSTRCPN